MHSKLCIDPAIILNPLSFAVHIAAIGETSHPLGVPAAWLWEELARRYSMLTLADLFLWLENDVDRCMRTPINIDQYACPDASIAMLLAARHLGYVIPTATTHSRRQFFEQGDWSGYLRNALGHEWEEFKDNKHIADVTWTTAITWVAYENNYSVSDLEALYVRNRNYDTRNEREYPIYERLRFLAVILYEMVVGLDAGNSVSTTSPSLRNIIVQELSKQEGVFVPPKELPFQPLIEKVIIKNKEATVRDIFAITGLNRLEMLVGGTEELYKKIHHELSIRELSKKTAMYLLGLVPVVGNIITAIEGAELLQDLWEVKHNNVESSPEALLYFSSTDYRAIFHDENNDPIAT